MNEAIQKINDLRVRVLQAKTLRKEGKPEEADKMEPTREELRQGLIALRSQRSTISVEAAAKAQKRKEAKAPLDLAALFTKPPQEKL